MTAQTTLDIAGLEQVYDALATAIDQAGAEKSELLDAYRLPNGLFETTDVVTDIIILKKK